MSAQSVEAMEQGISRFVVVSLTVGMTYENPIIIIIITIIILILIIIITVKNDYCSKISNLSNRKRRSLKSQGFNRIRTRDLREDTAKVADSNPRVIYLKSRGNPIKGIHLQKSSNWTPAIRHPRDRASITCK